MIFFGIDKTNNNCKDIMKKKHQHYFFVLLFLSSSFNWTIHAQKTSFTELRTEKESAVKDLSRTIRQRLERDSWCRSGEYCHETPCALNTCNGDLGRDAECQYDLIAHCDCNDQSSFRVSSSDISTPAANCPARALNDAQCAAFQPKTSGHRGQLLNSKQPTFDSPPQFMQSDGDGSPILVTDASVRRDLCALKAEAENIRTIYSRHNLTSWFYVGTEHAVSVTYPGHFQCRNENSQDKLNSCHSIAPERPWYITAATGDRDIVFMYDRNIGSSATLSSAFLDAIGTTDERDAIAVHAFDDGATTTNWLLDEDDAVSVKDGVEPDDRLYQLQNLNFTRKNSLVDRLPKSGITRASNLTAALDTAFRILRESTVSTDCTRLIVVFLGSNDVCFASCGINSPSTSNRSTSCSCVSNILQFISEQQAILGDANPANIVVLTEPMFGMSLRATSHMERLASSIACATKAGMWHGVIEGESPRTAMKAFTQVSSLLQYDDGSETPNVFGTDVYHDIGGLGEMFTLSAPVYDFNGRRLVAVVGVDILISEVITRTGLSDQEAREEIQRYSLESRTCKKDALLDPCDVQALRFNTVRSNVCAPPSAISDGGESSETDVCFELRGKYYRNVQTGMSFNHAQQHCASLGAGGSLPVISDKDESSAMTALFSADGSWIGARIGTGGDRVVQWVNGSAVLLRGDEFGQGYRYMNGTNLQNMTNVLQLGSDADLCVVADRRGTTHNWGLEPCSDRRPFVCHVPEETCHASTIKKMYRLQTEAAGCADLDRVGERICNGLGEKAIATARPFCNQTGSNSSNANRFCCGSSADPRKYGKEDKQESLHGTGGTIIVFVIVGVVGLVLFSVLVIVSRARTNRWNGNPGEEGEGIDSSNNVGTGQESNSEVHIDSEGPQSPPEESNDEILENGIQQTTGAEDEASSSEQLRKEWKISIHLLNLQWYSNPPTWPFQRRS